MKTSIKTFGIAIVALIGAAEPASAVLITDDIESGGGWVADGGGTSWVDTSGGAVGGLSATAGSEYLYVTATGVRRIEKTWAGQYVFGSNGTISVSIDVGDRNDKSVNTRVNSPELFADIDGSGTFTAGERLGSASGTDVVDGWATFTLNVDLSAETNAWGAPIAFSIRTRNNSGEAVSYDNLRIESLDGGIVAIPEPATLGLIAAFGGSLLFIRRRFML